METSEPEPEVVDLATSSSSDFSAKSEPFPLPSPEPRARAMSSSAISRPSFSHEGYTTQPTSGRVSVGSQPGTSGVQGK